MSPDSLSLVSHLIESLSLSRLHHHSPPPPFTSCSTHLQTEMRKFRLLIACRSMDMVLVFLASLRKGEWGNSFMLRIQNLVRSRLPNFFPLMTEDIRGSDQPNSSVIDYMGQFNHGESSKQASGKKNVVLNSARSRKQSKKTNVEEVSQGSGSWVNPKSSTKTPKNASKRRVQACSQLSQSAGQLSQSVGHWYTGSNGKTFDRCAVIGNSGDILKTRFGNEIDGHDAVLRENGAPIQNFTEFVGKKSTFRLLNRGSAKALDKVAELYETGKEVLLVKTTIHDIMNRMIQEIPILNPVYLMLGASFGSAAKGTGLKALEFALSICDSVDMYGFTVDPGYKEW